MDSALTIDIDRIPREGLNVSRDFDFMGQDLLEESAVFLEPAHAELFIRREDDEVYVQGEVRTRLSLVCSRCLVPFDFNINSSFDLVYMPEEIDLVNDELSDDDVDQMFYSDGLLDIRGMVLEQLNLMFPTKPLCSPDCEGICAVCGQIIRDGRCSCSVKETDPRWEKLKTLTRDKT